MNESFHCVCTIESIIRESVEMMVIALRDRGFPIQSLRLDILSCLNNVMFHDICSMDMAAFLSPVDGNISGTASCVQYL